jgi:hypothetical protein
MEGKMSIESPTESAMDKHEDTAKIPAVSFNSFILSLATSALIHIGEEANPATGIKQVDLPNARQVIDLLTLLKQKTVGNLSQEEENLISQLLYTLRMKFIALEKRSP